MYTALYSVSLNLVLLCIPLAIFLTAFFIAADNLMTFNTTFSSNFFQIYFLVSLLPCLTIYLISCGSLLQNLLIFESAVNSICTLLVRYLNNSSHSESDYILHCPLLVNESSSSVSSTTLPVTLSVGAFLSSAFS